MKPVYKIEVWQNDSLLYTITDEALNIRIKKTLTNSVGTFTFTLPVKFGNSYRYNDINLFDTVKIWLGYGSVSGDPELVGKITRINGPLSTREGYIRIFSGRDQGEILLRRFKRNKRWATTDASTIITEIANDLGLGTSEIETDTTDVDLTVEAEPYFDVLQKVSDYWYDATTQIKKDFYVDVDNNLVWKSRPIRTSGVETLTIGDNIISYNVLRDVETVKNKIYVYGAQQASMPPDKDAWTESLTNWTAEEGTLSLEADSDTATPQVGTYLIRCKKTDPTGEVDIIFQYNLTTEEQTRLKNPNSISLYSEISPIGADYYRISLLAPDTSNYYWTNLSTEAGWTLQGISLGPGNEYSSSNTNRDWRVVGSPSWQIITAIRFHGKWPSGGSGDYFCDVDGLFLEPAYYFGEAENSTSQTNYGLREAKFVDSNLMSDNECTKRAETLLYQLKDPTIRLDLVCLGNTNIKIGDRITMSIPAENINNVDFDVITVEHILNQAGFITQVTMINTAETRTPPPASVNEVLFRKFAFLKETAKGIQIIK